MEKAILEDSQAFLGAPYRLYIAKAIASLEPEFTNKRLLEALPGVEPSVVSRNLAKLASTRVLEVRARGHFRRGASEYWSLCHKLLEELEEHYSIRPLRSLPDASTTT